MKPIMIFGTWFLTLLLGLLISTMAFQSMEMGFLFATISAIGSLGYLFFMIIFAFFLQDFWKQQIVHLVTTIMTIMVLLILEEDFVTDLFWMPIPYFAVALTIQYLFYKNSTQQVATENATE